MRVYKRSGRLKVVKIKIIITAVVLVVVLTLSLSLYFTRYMWDVNDTEELYLENVAKVGYENTIETAIPQTEIYNMITAHFGATLSDGKTAKKAIVIGYDGCRADILAEMGEENSGIKALLADGASLNLGYCGGANYPEKNVQDTSTAPGWCSILTGKWATEHGVTGNNITKNMETKTLLTSLTEDGVVSGASFITKWNGHFVRKKATYLNEKAYCEEKGLNVAFNKAEENEDILSATKAELAKENGADFIFTIYEQTDSVGHNKGFSFNNPKYKEAFKEIDAYGYETINAIKARPTYESEDWLIIIASDHGGIKTNHGKASIQERMTFIVSNK